jgi:hypothetical protein
MTRQEDSENDRIEEFIEAGSEIAGGAAAAAIGFLGGGAPGVLGGAAAGPLIVRSLRWVASELKQRFLGPREEIRVGAVMAFAAQAVQDRLQAGETPRSDSFFEAEPGDRSSGDEIVEGTLLAAQRDPEERKLPYLGRLLASIAFTPRISRADANQLIQQFERLSYRQVLMLHLFAQRRFSRKDDFRGQSPLPIDLVYVLYDAHDLYARGFINIGGEVMFGPGDLKPAQGVVQGVGGEIYNLAGLNRVDDSKELDHIVAVVDSAPAKPAT